MYRKEKERERDKGKERKRGSTRRRIKRKWALSIARGTAGERGETGCGTAIIVAFPTDKVTAREYFLFPAADRARITRKES